MIDLRSHFKYVEWRPMAHSFSIDVGSDWADKSEDDPVFGLYKNCGLWTMQEADILYRCAKGVYPGRGLDVGAHTAWTTAHIAEGGLRVVAVDPMLRVAAFQQRFEQNIRHWWQKIEQVSHLTSSAYFDSTLDKFGLVCIDGDHSPGFPLLDAVNAVGHLEPTGVILLHDFIGLPVRDAVTWLMNIAGFKVRVYRTPHMVAVAWRGDFVPPDHVSDPRLPDLFARCPEFDFSRCV